MCWTALWARVCLPWGWRFCAVRMLRLSAQPPSRARVTAPASAVAALCVSFSGFLYLGISAGRTGTAFPLPRRFILCFYETGLAFSFLVRFHT